MYIGDRLGNQGDTCILVTASVTMQGDILVTASVNILWTCLYICMTFTSATENEKFSALYAKD